MLYRCINRIQNDNGEVTAIETSFEFLDDFQDPIKGGIYGLVNTLFANPTVQEDENLELQPVDPKKYPVSPVKFNKHNHVLQWMVKRIKWFRLY